MDIRNLTGKDPNYDFIISLGQGGFGSVAKVRRTSDGKIMACKAIDCSPNPLILEYAHREVKTWAAFADSEKYIANFGRDVAWTERTKTIRLYMDYYEGGDLQRVIDGCKHEDTLIHPFIATYWAMEVARGVKSCHDHGIIHRDLKPANVLLAMPYKYNEVLWAASEANILTDEQKTLATEFLNWLETRPPWCHITDFGLGKFSAAAMASGRHSLASYGPLGTPGFMAPEVLGADPRFSIKSDVYSLGCLIYSLATCRLPGSQLGSAFARTPELPTDYPVRMRQIVARCLSKEPAERPNSREVANEISEAFMDMMEHEKFGQMRAKLSSNNNVPNHRQYANKSSEELDDLLRDAVYRGDVETMTALIGAGANVNICVYQ